MSRALRVGLLILGSLLIAGSVFASVGLADPLSDATKGKATFGSVCAVCHGLEGTGGPIAPPLAKDLTYFKEVGLPVQALYGLLSQATKERPPGSIMPVYNPGKINDADATDIADYLWSLTPAPAAVIPPGNEQAGAAPYAANCASCHGAKGEGGAGPPLAAMVAQFKAGGAPAPVMHALVRLATRSGELPKMPTFAADKLSNGALADIAAFIWTLPAPAGPPPAAPAPAPPKGGKAVYDAVCAVCHGLEGKGGPIAPPLAKDLTYFKEVGLPPQAVTGLLIQATKERAPGSIMPVYNPGKVSDEDVTGIADYLWSLTPAPAAVIPPGNAQAGAAPYAANCASCHGAKGEGGAGPPLAGMAAGLKAGGAPAPVMHALVRLATRSGALPTMPTYTPDKLSNTALADMAAFIWDLPAPAPPPAQPASLPKTGDSPPSSLVLLGLLGAAVLAAGVTLRAWGRNTWRG